MTSCLRLLLLGLMACPALLAEPAIIAKARAYLGSEAALDAVTSMRYVGSVDSVSAPGAKPVHTTIDVIFKKPYLTRTFTRTGDNVGLNGLNDLEGWERLQDSKNPSKFVQRWSDPRSVLLLRATIWQNLYFYRALPRQAVEVIDRGPDTADGIAAERVDFNHGDGIVFTAYFDRSTGRRILIETPTETIRETGEIVVAGIRFYRVATSLSKLTPGAGGRATVTFDKILVNEAVPDNAFEAPDALSPVAVPAGI